MTASNFQLGCCRCSESARQSHIQFVRRFARDAPYGQKQARKEPIKTRGRNTEYNIARCGHQKVAHQKSKHNSTARLLIGGLSGAVRESDYDPLQPMKVEVGDGTSAGESKSDTPAEPQPSCCAEKQGQSQHEIWDTFQCPGVECIGPACIIFTHKFFEEVTVRINSTNPAMIPTISPPK